MAFEAPSPEYNLSCVTWLMKLPFSFSKTPDLIGPWLLFLSLQVFQAYENTRNWNMKLIPKALCAYEINAQLNICKHYTVLVSQKQLNSTFWQPMCDIQCGLWVYFSKFIGIQEGDSK